MKNKWIDTSQGVEFGIISLGDYFPDLDQQIHVSQEDRLLNMVKLGQAAEEMGYDLFGVGESHQAEYISSAPELILSHIAALTHRIKLSSATTVLSLHDPVRVYESFATLDLLSNGRAEIMLGRGSRHQAYQLFGYDLRDYDELFADKLDLLLALNHDQPTTWSGQYRPDLDQAELYPKPLNNQLPIWRVVGQSTSSAREAGSQGLPANFSYLWTGSSLFNKRVDIYRQALQDHGYSVNQVPISISGALFIADDTNEALALAYQQMQHTFKLIHGINMNKQDFINARSYKHPLMVGNAQLIKDKLLYQYEQFNYQRFTFEIDNGNRQDQVHDQMARFADQVMGPVKEATKS